MRLGKIDIIFNEPLIGGFSIILGKELKEVFREGNEIIIPKDILVVGNKTSTVKNGFPGWKDKILKKGATVTITREPFRYTDIASDRKQYIEVKDKTHYYSVKLSDILNLFVYGGNSFIAFERKCIYETIIETEHNYINPKMTHVTTKRYTEVFDVEQDTTEEDFKEICANKVKEIKEYEKQNLKKVGFQ